jgi:hypothetical protein
MYKTEDSIDEINKYFGTSYPRTIVIPDFGLDKPSVFPMPSSIYSLAELMRFVWRIQEEGFIVNIQDLSRLDEPTNYRIWFNLEEGMIECPFGQISQSAASGYLEGTTLEYCLIYSIGEWCKFGKYIKQNIAWRRIRDVRQPNVKWEGYYFIDGNEILLYRIHDLDYFNLEMVDYAGDVLMLEMPETYFLADVKQQATMMMYSKIISIVKQKTIYNLKNH